VGLGVCVFGQGEPLGPPPFCQQQRLLVTPLCEDYLDQERRGTGQKAQFPDLLVVLADRA
jgi:hypothetical protein